VHRRGMVGLQVEISLPAFDPELRVHCRHENGFAGPDGPSAWTLMVLTSASNKGISAAAVTPARL
jgi:hypothetical protein